jgi:Fe-Mn family superoxide dismutase
MTYSTKANQELYPFTLPALPYGKGDLVPFMTEETFNYHHEKHHAAYVTNLNKLLESNQNYSNMNLEQIIIASFGKDAGIFNNAAQVWNHSFFWHSMKKSGGGKPEGRILEAIERDFGNYEKFVEEFKSAGATQFGSGWAWLVCDSGRLKITKTPNAETPITSGLKPIICCDVWEHAYYIDYQNRRPDFLSAFLNNLVNWDFAEENFAL